MIKGKEKLYTSKKNRDPRKASQSMWQHELERREKPKEGNTTKFMIKEEKLYTSKRNRDRQMLNNS